MALIMQTDNHNRRIAKNTMMLYVRMLITMLIGLYTSRVVLATLGISDYGLYNVVGGVVVMFNFVQGTIAGGTQRFLTFEIGRGNMDALKKVFSTAIIAHLVVIAIILILAETIGLWFVQNKMVFEAGRETAAWWVYQFSVLACIVSLFQSPFMASLIAHEKMSIYAYMSIYDAAVKLAVAILIQWSPIDTLVYYAFLILLANLTSSFIYNTYCRHHFSECRFSLAFDKSTFNRMFKFSVWDTIGSIAAVGQAQGVNIVINMFCGTVVNAARGISVTVNTMVMQFVNNFQMAANPQLVKYYANNQMREMARLAINTASFSTYLLLLIGIPVFLETEYLLGLWLGEYPDYAPVFCRIILLQSLVQAMGTPTMRALHAVGNIRMMNILVGALLLLILPLTYLLFWLDCPAEVVLTANIIPWLLAIPIRLVLLKHYIGFPLGEYVKEVMIKGTVIALLCSLLPFIVHTIMQPESFFRLCVVGITSIFSSSAIIFSLGINKDLRNKIINRMKRLIPHSLNRKGKASIPKKKILVYSILLISISFNFLCFLPYSNFYIDRLKERIWPTQYYKSDCNDKVVIHSVLQRSMKMDGTAFNTEQPKRGLPYDLGMLLNPPPTASRFNDSSISFLYWGLSEYAVKSGNSEVICFLENKIRTFTNTKGLTYPLKEVDQVPIGNCFLNLYLATKKDKYLSYATGVYTWLKNKREPGTNIIYYRSSCPNQFVDGLGMFVPFLAKYHNATGDTLAYRMALDNIDEFHRFGVDKETGLPTHGYNKTNHIKLGSANWGRGIGWYVLAAAYLPHFFDSVLDKNLPAIGNSQFPLTSGAFDSSVALMFEIYMQKRGIHPHSLNFIKPYITTDGLVTNCSGDTYDFNNHSRTFTPAELTNGLFLLLAAYQYNH